GREARIFHCPAAARLSAPHLLLDLRLRRERSVCWAQGLRSADSGRSGPRLDHRHDGAVARRRIGRRRHHRTERVRGEPGSSAGAAAQRRGAELSLSMFDAMADWMAVPLMQQEAGKPPQRVGLTHAAIAPYGAVPPRDGVVVLIALQSDREWRVLAEKVLDDPALAADPRFATNLARVQR